MAVAWLLVGVVADSLELEREFELFPSEPNTESVVIGWFCAVVTGDFDEEEYELLGRRRFTTDIFLLSTFFLRDDV